MKRTEFPGLSYLKLEAFSVSVPKSTGGSIGVASGVNVLGVNMDGAIIARSTSSSRVIIVPPRSMFFIKGFVRLSALAAKGEHRLQTLSWHSASLPSLDQWLQTLAPGRNTKGMSRNVGCKPIDPDFVETIKRFEEAKLERTEITEPLLLSVVYESVGRIMVGSDEMQLSPLPRGLPEPITKLTEAVRKKPNGNWSLKEASDMASYSPFHFSRVFKQMVGYGFHEYVDRCRTELAVNMLVTSDIAVDNVATNSGFGTTQGLRESVRDYLGLVPSEFRSLPEVYETSGV
ncbi:MAG: helix-turn-helix transcriptional regulator [Chlorobia bacterium]|nr:helix-turn-helix transcriptional regulator [Fimbriimonadaceae bacterium]